MARRAGVLRLCAALVAGGALVGTAAATDVTVGPREAGPAAPAAQTSAPDRASYLTEAVLACPGTPEGTDEVGAGLTTLAVASAPEDVFSGAMLPDGDPGGMVLALAGAGGGEDATEGTTEDSAEEGGEAFGATLEVGRWGLLRAHGQQAPGVVGSQVSLVPDAGTRGWALSPCLQPEDLVHLVGGGEGAGRVEHLIITNPASDPVTVDVEVFGADGAVTTVGGSGLVIPAHGRLVKRLDALAPSVQQPVVRITAQGGPVAAHLTERHREGTTDLGREVAAPAASPDRELVLPALPGSTEGEQTVTLRLFAPEAEAVVELRALTDSGAAVPETAVVRVPAGGTTEVELEDLPAASALRLRSDEPVTAGALLRVTPSSDEPIVVGEGGPDGAARTAGPDSAARTAGPDGAARTTAQDQASSTAGPDEATATAQPDEAARTAAPADEEADRQTEPVLHPAGETAWVAAVRLSQTPLGMAVPDLADVPRLADLPGTSDEEGADGDEEGPGARDEGAEQQGADELHPPLTLAVSVADATTASVLWLERDGGVSREELALAHDTTQLLEAPAEAVAFWVLPTGEAGVAAALHLSGADVVGPYLSATSVPPVPWTRQVPAVVPVLP